MGAAKHLPIWKDAQRLVKMLHETTRKAPRDLRRSTVRRAHTALDEIDTNQHPEATVTSYLAAARHADTHRLRTSMADRARQAGLTVDPDHTKAS